MVHPESISSANASSVDDTILSSSNPAQIGYSSSNQGNSSLLTTSGKLRENGDDVEIWSQDDDEVGAVRYLVEEAMLCRKAYDDDNFILIVAVTRALTTIRIPMIFKFEDDLTIDDLVARVNTRFGPPQRGLQYQVVVD